jgi:hypothetical protein
MGTESGMKGFWFGRDWSPVRRMIQCAFFFHFERESSGVFFSLFFEGKCLFFLTLEFKGYLKKKILLFFLLPSIQYYFAYYVWSSQTLLNLINYTKKCQYI